MREKLINNKKLFIAIFASLALLIGMSFAIYNITLEGKKNHSIKTNKLTFSYKEPQDALNFLAYDSYTDEEGKNLENFYEIKVKATSEAREVIDYVIYLQKEESEKMYNSSDLKLYLTKVVNGVEQEVVAPTLVSNFTEYNNIMDTLAIYGDSFSFETNNNEVKETTYRLRIWLKDGFDFNKLATSVNTNGEQNIKLESYEFKFKVNVATGKMPTESKIVYSSTSGFDNGKLVGGNVTSLSGGINISANVPIWIGDKDGNPFDFSKYSTLKVLLSNAHSAPTVIALSSSKTEIAFIGSSYVQANGKTEITIDISSITVNGYIYDGAGSSATITDIYFE